LLKKLSGNAVAGNEIAGFGGGGAGRFNRTSNGFSAALAAGNRKHESSARSTVQKAIEQMNCFMAGKRTSNEYRIFSQNAKDLKAVTKMDIRRKKGPGVETPRPKI